MKRVALAALGGACFALLSVAQALASSELPQPHRVLGRVVRPPGASGSLAFTGAGGTIRLWMVLAAALLIVGTAVLIATRRRRASDTQ
jgi:hypothetical protein